MKEEPVSRKVLIVEDERAIARALELKLTHSGLYVEIATDGEDALRKVAKSKFDIILLDLVIPKKDGFAVLKTLQEKHKDTPVIVASNLGQESDIQRAKEFGISEYFVKSEVTLNDIVSHIKTVLDTHTL